MNSLDKNLNPYQRHIMLIFSRSGQPSVGVPGSRLVFNWFSIALKAQVIIAFHHSMQFAEHPRLTPASG